MHDFASEQGQIAKSATENVILRHFKRGNAFLYLKESTVHGWVKMYEDRVPAGGLMSAARKAKGQAIASRQ